MVLCESFTVTAKATDSQDDDPDKAYTCPPPPSDSDTKMSFNFAAPTPIASIVAMVFVGVWFVFVIIAKIMYNSTDQYKINNRFDLVIFKPATKNSLVGPRRIYSNNNVNIQNIHAATASGMDMSFLYQRNASISQSIHPSMSESNVSLSGSGSTNKITSM
jgi:hypothetical protein